MISCLVLALLKHVDAQRQVVLVLSNKNAEFLSILCLNYGKTHAFVQILRCIAEGKQHPQTS